MQAGLGPSALGDCGVLGQESGRCVAQGTQDLLRHHCEHLAGKLSGDRLGRRKGACGEGPAWPELDTLIRQMEMDAWPRPRPERCMQR